MPATPDFTAAMLALASSPVALADHAPAWAALLERFYAQFEIALPRLERLKEEDMPQPYKSLLVHSADMTPTLEKFYQQRLGLKMLSRLLLTESEYLREVALHINGAARPVEYGVIRIWLDHFPVPARRLIQEEQRPLGSILQSEAVGHISWPQAFFRVESDAHIGAVLRLAQPCLLYGRRNVLLDGGRRLLAEVIEILAPVENGKLS